MHTVDRNTLRHTCQYTSCNSRIQKKYVTSGYVILCCIDMRLPVMCVVHVYVYRYMFNLNLVYGIHTFPVVYVRSNLRTRDHTV